MEINQHFNDKKCYNCGKEFKYIKDLERHKDRKTPCLIRDVTPEDMRNPNRCIFCNKIFVNQFTKDRHYKVCKIKNGGMEILVDKVIMEQEIRNLKEMLKEKEESDKRRDTEFANFKKQMEEKFNNMVITPQPAINITNNNNLNLQFNINLYTNPSVDKLKITLDEIINYDKVSKLLFKKMYFNPDLPQNHCMYLVNKKDRSLLLNDEEGWRIVSGDNLETVIQKLSNVIALKGSDILNALGNPGSDELFMSLPPTSRDKIIQFNMLKDMLSKDDAYEIFISNRDIVYETIRNSGCKLLT
jgi:hypothetical protein